MNREAEPKRGPASSVISRRGFLRLGYLAAGAASAAVLLEACKSGQGQEVKATPTQPPNSPVATETIAPTPTAIPTEVPTVEPTPTLDVSNPEEVNKELERLYAELSDSLERGLGKINQSPPDRTLETYREEIRNQFKACNGEDDYLETSPEQADYAGEIIFNCINLPPVINGIPGREDILEFSEFTQKLGDFTLLKMDQLFAENKFWQDLGGGQKRYLTTEEFEANKVDVANKFPK